MSILLSDPSSAGPSKLRQMFHVFISKRLKLTSYSPAFGLKFCYTLNGAAVTLWDLYRCLNVPAAPFKVEQEI